MSEKKSSLKEDEQLSREKEQALNDLIASALSDNKLSGKEMEVILKKAKELGKDPAEFEIILEARRFNKMNKKSFSQHLNRVIYHREKGTKKQEKQGVKNVFGSLITGEKEYENVPVQKITIRLWHIMAVLLTVMIIVIGIISLVKSSTNEQAAITKKYGCENFDDCIAKYKFEGGYYYMSQATSTEKLFMNKQLTSSQLSYWTKDKNYVKAFNILQEFVIEAKYTLSTDDDELNLPYNEEVTFYNNLLDDLINKMIVEDESKATLLLYCKSFKSIIIGDENNKGFFGGYNSYILSDEPYKTALVKINEK